MHAGDDAEQAVAANRQPEQLRVLAARAGADDPRRVQQVEGLDLIDDGLEVQASPVGVARQRAAEAQAVGARLLLDDAPTLIVGVTHGTRISRIRYGTRISRIVWVGVRVSLRAVQVFENGGPEDAALDGDEPALGVEGEHPVERARVDEHAGLAELLAAHRVASTRDRHRLTVPPCPRHRRRQFTDGTRGDDRIDARGVQLRVDVVDEHAGRRVRSGPKRQGFHALRLRDWGGWGLEEELKKA